MVTSNGIGGFGDVGVALNAFSARTVFGAGVVSGGRVVCGVRRNFSCCDSIPCVLPTF